MTQPINPVKQESDKSRGLRVLLVAALLWCAVVVVLWVLQGWLLKPGRSEYGQFSPEIPWEQFRALAAWVALNLCALGWGAMVAKRLRVLPRGGWQRAGVVLMLGHVAMGLVIFAVGSVHLYPMGLLVLLGGLGGLPILKRLMREASFAKPRKETLPLLIVAAAGMTLAFLLAFAPVTESDGVRYQLVTPQEYLKAGGIVHLRHQAFTNLPAQTNLLYLAGMSVADPRVAQLIHWTYLPMVMLFAGGLGDRLYRALIAQHRRDVQPGNWTVPWPVVMLFAGSRLYCGMIARQRHQLQPGNWTVPCGALAVCSPAFLVLGAWPFIDLSTAAFSLAAVWALCPGSIRSLDRRLLLAGIMGGGAIATKLTALVTIAILGVVVLGMIAARAGKIRRLLLFIIPIIIVSGPWFLKNTLFHHNPVYPAAVSIFGSEEWSADAAQLYSQRSGSKGYGKSFLYLTRSPYDATVNWLDFEGHNPGPALLALLPIALAGIVFHLCRCRMSVAGWLFLTQLVLGWLAWFFTYQSIRFLLVQIALTAAGGTAVLAVMSARIRGCGCWVRAALLVLALCGTAWYYFWATAHKPARPLVPALGLVGKDEYLSANLNFYDAVQWLNLEAQPGEKVYFIGEHRALYSRFELVHSDWFDVPRVLVDIRATESNEELLKIWREQNVRYLLWNYDELMHYEESAFRPRFTDAEWQRYVALRDRLLRRNYVVFSPRENIFIIDLKRAY